MEQEKDMEKIANNYWIEYLLKLGYFQTLELFLREQPSPIKDDIAISPENGERFGQSLLLTVFFLN